MTEAVRVGGLPTRRLESPMEKVFEIYIRTTPERLWEAITDSETRSKYQFGMRLSSDWTQGSRFEMSNPGTGDLLGRVRTSKSIPLADWFRPWWRCGATM